MTEERLRRLQQKIRARKLDGIIISRLVNVRYLTGFTGSAGWLLVTPEEAAFHTDFRYEEQASQQVRGCRIVIARGSLLRSVGREVERRGLRLVAIESHHITLDQKDELARCAPRAEWVSARRVVESLRVSKSADELDAIRRAVQIADEAFAEVVVTLRPGLAEREVARRLHRAMERRGAEGAAFETIVASGFRSALPHGVASAKKLATGELIVIDFGAVYAGYCSDLTRTVCLGKANTEQKRIYRIVREAQLRAEERLQAGLTGREVDAAAREHIAAQGYGDRFGHGLGHGVGMEVHEGPTLSRSSRTRLPAGSIVTIEPGIYIKGWGGVRIEDMALVAEGRCEVITSAPKPPRLPEI